MPSDDPITVTPLAETAEPVEAQVTAPSPQPEAQAPPADSPAAEPVEGVSQDPPKDEQPKADPPPKPEKSYREKLIDQLTGVEEPKSTDEDDEPTPPAKPQDGEPPKPEDTPKDKPEEPLPEDLNELTNDTAKAMKPGDVRRKINRLIKRVKDAEPLAGMAKEIIEVCEKNGLAPNDYRAWVDIGIGIQNGDPAAIARFAGIAEKVGIKAEAPAAAPALTPEVEAWLDAQVKDLEMSATAAAELRKRLGAAPPKPVAPPTPAPQAPAPRQPAQRPPQDPVLAARQAATNEIGKIADEYEVRIGAARFKELEPRIMAALAQRKGKSPDAWPDIFRSVVEIELARAPKPAQIQSNLRPGGQAGSSTPQFKTERERAIHRLTTG